MVQRGQQAERKWKTNVKVLYGDLPISDDEILGTGTMPGNQMLQWLSCVEQL